MKPSLIYRTSLFITLLFITKSATAQLPSTSVWLTAQLSGSLSAKWQWYNDLTYKTLAITATAYQRFYRTGLRFQISKAWNTAGGIGFFSTNTSTDKGNDEFGREFRLWQELNYQHDFKKKLSIQSRIRTEERYLEETDTKPSSRILNINYRISFTKPVSKKWDILFGEEYFEQVISRNFIFNQNRLITAGVYTIDKTTQLQGGYIWALRKTFSQHILQFTFKKLFLLNGKKDQRKKPAVSHLPEAE